MNYLNREFDTNGLKLCEYQGKLFEEATNKYNCSSPVFIRRFLKSNLVKKIDMNETSFLDLNVNNGLEEIEKQFKRNDYGKVKYSSQEMFWIGYMYRYICYTRRISSTKAFELFDYKVLKNNYFSFHTQSPEWVLRNLLELSKHDETIFDKNVRLKQLMIKQDRFKYKV